MRPATLGCGGPRLLAWALSISPPGAQSARHTEQLRVRQGPRSFREPVRGARTLGEGGQVAPRAGIRAAASGAVGRGSAVRRGGGGLTRPVPTAPALSQRILTAPLASSASRSCPGLLPRAPKKPDLPFPSAWPVAACSSAWRPGLGAAFSVTGFSDMTLCSGRKVPASEPLSSTPRPALRRPPAPAPLVLMGQRHSC